MGLEIALDVADLAFARLRAGLEALGVPVQRAYVTAQVRRARSGTGAPYDGRVLTELPRVGLGAAIGAAVDRWLWSAVPPRDVGELLGDGVTVAPPELLAEMPPLEWRDRACAATLAARAELHLLAVVDDAAEIGRFCANVDHALARLDLAHVAAWCRALV
ncbi:MAG: hypothetical protein ABI867_31695 [Kofleriaceae bacterium]